MGTWPIDPRDHGSTPRPSLTLLLERRVAVMAANGGGSGSGDGHSGSGGRDDGALRALPHVTTDGFTLRRLVAADFSSNYMALLGQLTRAPPVAKAAFEAFVAAADADGTGHLVLVAQAPLPPGADAGLAPPSSPPTPIIAATATLLVERKLVRGGAPAGHLEDVVVDALFRGTGLGRRMVDALTAEARRRGCYKVILDCAESNVEFYRRCGYETKELQMARYF